MTAGCDASGGTLSTTTMTVAGCPTDDLSGWCVVHDVDGTTATGTNGDTNKFTSTLMTISPASDCDGNEMACTTFVGGTFVPDKACVDPSSSSSSSSSAANDDDSSSMMSLPSSGRCVHSYDISEGMGCFEFRGSGWSSSSTSSMMIDRCDGMTDGRLDVGVGCVEDDVLVALAAGSDENNIDVDVDVVVAGWCETITGENMHEASLMVMTDGADCASNGMVCKTFEGGTFVPDGACATGEEDGGDEFASSSSSSQSSSSSSSSIISTFINSIEFYIIIIKLARRN